MPTAATDPSRAGGLCRQRCYNAKDRAACCKTKKGVCKDADCDASTGAYTGTQVIVVTGNTKPRFAPPSRVASAPGPVQCSKWATTCATYSNPGDCCAAKPMMCYDQNCIGGKYVTIPVVLYGSTFTPANAAPTITATCGNNGPFDTASCPQQTKAVAAPAPPASVLENGPVFGGAFATAFAPIV